MIFPRNIKDIVSGKRLHIIVSESDIFVVKTARALSDLRTQFHGRDCDASITLWVDNKYAREIKQEDCGKTVFVDKEFADAACERMNKKEKRTQSAGKKPRQDNMQR